MKKTCDRRRTKIDIYNHDTEIMLYDLDQEINLVEIVIWDNNWQCIEYEFMVIDSIENTLELMDQWHGTNIKYT